MAANEYEIPACVQAKIGMDGSSARSNMISYIQTWWDWYCAEDDFYKISYTTVENAKKHRDRLTVYPARRVCLEWASLLLNEDTSIYVDAPRANEWLNEYLLSSNFWPTGQGLIEKAFALGTAAWALWFCVQDEQTRVMLRSYDARMVVPLSWDCDGVTECAFATRVTCMGKPADQLQMHVIEDGTYHIKTYIFIDDVEVDPEPFGVIADFDTMQSHKTFGIIKPALENTFVDLSPYGMSIFGDAVSAIKAVDLAYDAIFQEIELTPPRIFMDETMLDVRSSDGKLIPYSPEDERIYRKTASENTDDFIQVSLPEMRISDLRQAFDVALAELGELCGFGQDYFMLDRSSGGHKTATEVASDNGALMRNIRKHENAIRCAIQDVIAALLECARIHCGAPIEEDIGAVMVQFDDSIITDVQSEKNQMMAEIAAGLLPKWKYAVEFYGMSEDEAKAALPQVDVIDIGY